MNKLLVLVLMIFVIGCSVDDGSVSPDINQANVLVKPKLQPIDPKYSHSLDSVLVATDYRIDEVFGGEYSLYVKPLSGRIADLIVIVSNSNRIDVRLIYEEDFRVVGNELYLKTLGDPTDILCVYLHCISSELSPSS